MRHWMTALAILICLPARAAGPDLSDIVAGHILPGYRALAERSAALAETAADDCAPDSPALRAAYGDAFDAWVTVSHLRFGPSEQADRAFALAFWPDPRGATPKALGALIRDADPVVDTAQGFATVSVAARGFYALEFLLYDPQFNAPGAGDYHCRLTIAVSRDIAAISAAILGDWEGGYGDLLASPGNETYRTGAEALRQLFTALLAGLEFTADARLGRPMGSFDRPRPNRAEARRSGRSLRHVVLSLEATRDLAARLSGNDAEIARLYDVAITRANALDDPVFAGVAAPQGRLRVEALKQMIDDIRYRLSDDLGPRLGIAAGFNSLDGD